MNYATIALGLLFAGSIAGNAYLLQKNSALEAQMQTLSGEITRCKTERTMQKESYDSAIEKIKEITKEAEDAKCTLKSARSGSFSIHL